jgi:hypothetical protein
MGGVAPKPPSRTAEGRVEGEKGVGHGALAGKAFLSSADAASAAAVAAQEARSQQDQHTEEEQQGERKRKGRDWRDKGPRIPCPHDPRHSIYEKELRHHINNCPMYKQMQAIKAQPFYSENINLAFAATAANTDLDEDAEELEERLRKESQGQVEPKIKTLLASLQAGVDMHAFCALVHKVYEAVVGSIPTEELTPSGVRVATSTGVAQSGGSGGGGSKEEGVRRAAEFGRRLWNSQRHEEQQRSIVGHMEKRGLLNKEFVFVEMGAGRGTLSLTLREAEPSCHGASHLCACTSYLFFILASSPVWLSLFSCRVPAVTHAETQQWCWLSAAASATRWTRR